MTCTARQVSDQMRCEQCNLLWDMNDPEPPECRTTLIDPQMERIKQLMLSIAIGDNQTMSQVLADVVSELLLSDSDDKFHVNGIEFMDSCDALMRLS